MDKENKLILYKDEEGWVSVNTRLGIERRGNSKEILTSSSRGQKTSA